MCFGQLTLAIKGEGRRSREKENPTPYCPFFSLVWGLAGGRDDSQESEFSEVLLRPKGLVWDPSHSSSVQVTPKLCRGEACRPLLFGSFALRVAVRGPAVPMTFHLFNLKNVRPVIQMDRFFLLFSLAI